MKKIFLNIFSTVVLLAGVGHVNATPIISGNGNETCEYGQPLIDLGYADKGECGVTTVTPHSAWQTNDPNGYGAEWISYGKTGIAGSTLAPPSGQDVVVRIFETLYVKAGDILSLQVWADDTAEVFVGSISKNIPNFTQSTCANGPIGCQPHEFGQIHHEFTSAGAFNLRFDLFQVGTGDTNPSNPFGLLYSGTLTSTSVPEPSVLALLASS